MHLVGGKLHLRLVRSNICLFVYFFGKFFCSLLARDLLSHRRTRGKTGRPLGGKEGGVPKSK